MRWATRAVAALGVAGVLTLAGAAAASADEDDWEITRYDVSAVLAPDGGALVTIDLDFDFGPDRDAHGPYLTIVERQEIAGDPDRYRVFEVSDVTATSSTGAPTDLLVEREDGAVVVRIGDEDTEIGGLQSYTVGYRLDSLVTPGGDVDAVVWNAVGLGWEVPMSDVSVTLTAPAEATGVRCVAGGVSSTTACDGVASSGGDGSVTVSQSRLAPGQGLTIAADYPAGTFPAAQPVFAHRMTWANSFVRDPASVGVAVLVAVGGAAAAVLARRRRGTGAGPSGLLGTTAGLADTPAAHLRVDRVALPPLPEGFRTEPPADLPPGEFGTLVDERAQPRDVVAVLLDLAVRGGLHIEVIPGKDDSATEGKDPDFELVRPDDPVDLRDYERELLAGIFPKKRTARLRKHGTRIATAVAKAREALDETVTANGWFTASPRRTRTRWVLWGIGLVLGGIAAAIVLALTSGWASVGVAVAIVGVVVICLSGGAPRMTTRGAELRAEALAFERYLRDVTAAQPTWDADRATLVPSVFERYLPYAVALGLEKRWTDAFSRALCDGDVAEPSWYGYGVPGGAGNATFVALVASGSFSQSLGDLGTGVAGAAFAGGSGGGSGGSSVSVGGGASGGGGGGW